MEPAGKLTLRQKLGLVLGPAVFLALQAMDAPAGMAAMFAGADPGSEVTGSAQAAWLVLSLTCLMAIWWVSEAIPIPVTSLLPIIVLPLGGMAPVAEVSGEYLHPVVVLLLGGFIIARAIERWNLHERIALAIVSRFSGSSASLVGGFMIAAATLSMWISNTATAIMLAPIVLSVAAARGTSGEAQERTALVLLLGVAWACSIGGLGTYIGTPTNLLIKDSLEASTGVTIDFLTWMAFGIPAVLMLTPIAWWVLVRWTYPLGNAPLGGGSEAIRERLAGLGPLTRPEKRVIAVFAFVAGLWMFGLPLAELEIAGVTPLAGLTDHVTAIIGVVLCFLIPAGSAERPGERLLDWRTAESIPWGVLLLFGGGMALAWAIRSSGLSLWIGSELQVLAALPVIVLILLVTTFVIFMTEITSNVATAASVMPVLIALAEGGGIDPVLFAAPVVLAASCAFMLPMATGPNAVVYATGHVTLPQMARSGLRLNLIAIGAITAFSYWFAPLVL